MFRRSAKVISIILTVAFIINVFVYPTQTALATNKTTDNHMVISYVDDTESSEPSEPTIQPEPSEPSEPTIQPEPSEPSEPTIQPEPSEPSEPTIQPEPSEPSEPSEQPTEIPEPTSSIEPSPSAEPTVSPIDSSEISEFPICETNLWPGNASLQPLLDESGFLTDDALNKLKTLPFDNEKYTEVTDLGNGKFGMKIFTEPIKFENEDGKLETIDNSIVEVDPKEDSKHEFKNAASDVEILMSDNLEEDSAIEMNYQGYSIGFKPLDILKKDKKTDDGLNFIENEKPQQEVMQETKDIKEETKDAIDTIDEGKTDEIRDEELNESKDYESVEYIETFDENTDIQITPTSTGMKEDIILYEIPEVNEFSYELTVEKVTPILRKDGNLYFVDLENGYLVASIPSPIMYDSKEEFSESYNINVKLEQTGENSYKYTLVPDRKFLEDHNTVYPVVLDPAAYINGGMIQDTFTTSRYSGNNYVNDANLKVGYGSDLYKSRGLIKIGTWPIGTGYTITYATYCAYQNYSGSSTPTIQAARILTQDWDPYNVNWANQPIDYYVESQQALQAIGWYSWNLTSLVKGWYEGWIGNYGIYLKSSNESSNMYKRFYSANSGTAPNYFYIEYYDSTPPSQPVSFTATNSVSGPTGTISLNWSGAVDYPVGGASGIHHYQVMMNENGTGWKGNTDVSGPPFSYTCYDNSTYQFGVLVFDANGYNSGWKLSNVVTTGDFTAPEWLPKSTYTIAVDNLGSHGYTNDLTPTVTWSGITDEGNHLNRLQYKFDSTTGTWNDIPNTYRQSSGTYIIPSSITSALSEGSHKIYLRGIDDNGNAGTIGNMHCKYVLYNKDTTSPSVNISLPGNEDVVPISGNVNNSYDIQATANDAHFKSWTLDYALGTDPSESDFKPENQIDSKGTKLESIVPWLLSSLNDNRLYTLRLRAEDTAGNKNVAKVIVLYAKDTDLIKAVLSLGLTYKDAEQLEHSIGVNDDITVEKLIASYTVNSGYTVPTELTGTLFANDVQVDTQTVSDPELAFDPLKYDDENDRWVYPEGSQVFLRLSEKDSNDNYYYTNSSYDGHKIADKLMTTGTNVTLSNTLINNGKVILQQGATQGYIRNQQEVNGRIQYVTLTPAETKPTGSSISYKLVTESGQEFTLQPNQKTPIDASMNTFYVEAVLDKGTAASSPELKAWYLDVKFIPFSDSRIIENSFVDFSRGYYLTGVKHDNTNGCITLYETTHPLYQSTGTVVSTVRNTPGNVYEVFLKTTQTVPTGTSIEYRLSTDGGQTWSTNCIQPGDDSNNDAQWFKIDDLGLTKGNQIVLKATLVGSGNATPVLDFWELKCRQTKTGEAHDVKLIDAPDNLSTLADANYMTLLRWEPSETKSITYNGVTYNNVTYNVYRSPLENGEFKLVATDITECSWSDYNLNFDQTFYYKVTAVLTIDGHKRESLPTNEAFATVVSEGEFNKRLGLEDYWSYSGFTTGSGSGYVNVSNGNLVYTSTDMIVSDPFFAMVMRRSFNSLANSKTPMGCGWDYSFNTTLMTLYDDINNDGIYDVETGMILKDGDGSFHVFNKVNDGYESASGTFMKLEAIHKIDEATGQNEVDSNGKDIYEEYRIIRKDNIVYHFNAQSMKLDCFTDNNGNKLEFKYDTRGNIKEITNSVGETLGFTYYSNGCNHEVTGGDDYIYVNDHWDMLKTVTWTENTTDAEPATITYTYTYDTMDRLKSSSTTIEDENIYQELYNYDDTAAKLTITDPEGKETVVSYNTLGQVGSITDAVGDACSFDYVVVDNYNTQNITTITNEYEADIKYKYNDLGYVYEIIDTSGESFNYEHNDALDGDTYSDPAFDTDVDDASLVTGMSYLNKVNDSETPELISYKYSYINGNLHSISGPDGSSTVYGDYNSFNKPLSVTVTTDINKSGTTTYHYDTHGNKDYETDPEGKTTSYHYDYNKGGILDYVVNPEGGITDYDYDEKGRVVSIAAKIGSTVKSETTYAYDYKVDDYFLKVTSTDGLGNSTYTYYNQLGKNKKTVYPDGTSVSNNYNLCGALDTSVDAKLNETTYDYDDLYRPTSVTYENGTSTCTVYTGWDIDNNVATGDEDGYDGDMIISSDGSGVLSIEYYDNSGRLDHKATSYGRNSSEEIIKNREEIIQYREQIIQNQIVVAQYEEYDLVGNCKKVKDNANRVAEAQYNALGQRTKTIVDPDGENIETVYGYDLLGNKKTVTDGEKYVTTYGYDSDLRLKTVVQVDNKGTAADTDDVTLTTSYSYDNDDQGSAYTITRVTDAKGQVTETWFDDLGRKVKDRNVGITGDSEDMVTSYDYNSNSQLYTVTRNDGTIEKYSYYNTGQIERIDYYEASEAANIVPDSNDYIYYEYWENGQKKLESVHHDNYEESTSYVYDNMNRLQQITEGSFTDGGLSIDYLYDDANRVKEISYTKGSSSKRTIGYIYDDYGRTWKITLALGTASPDIVREYVYKTDGDLAEGDLDYIKDYRDFNGDILDYVKMAYEKNGAGLTKGITYTDCNYNAASNTYTETQKEHYDITYDDRGYVLTENSVINYGTENKVDKTFTYDSIGRLLTAGNTTTINNTPTTKNTSYTYDNVGNRKTMNDGQYIYAYDYNQFNQLKYTDRTKISDSSFVDNYASYDYTDRGNQLYELIQVDRNGTTKTQRTDYTYDLMNQMTKAIISVPDELTTVSLNSYNASGQRIVRIDGTWNQTNANGTLDLGEVSTGKWVNTDNDGVIDSELQNVDISKYFYSGSALLFSTNANNYLMTENILDIGGNIIASARFEDETPTVPDDYYFYHYDMRGSTTAIIKPDGTLIKGYSYDEFGNTQQNGTSSFLNEVTFTGSVGDKSTGLQYMNARYYDPSNGRFLSQDSYSGNAYDPWTQHLYSYCGNNPVNMVDPTGHFVETVLDAASAAWSTTEMINNPSLENALYLLWDVASILLPFVPGSYVARGTKLLVEATTHVDEVVEVGTKVVDDVTKNVDDVAKNVDDVAKNVDDVAKNVDDVTKGEYHHIASDKSIVSGFTAKYKEIFERAGMTLKDQENIVFLKNHKGAHTKVYKEYVLKYLDEATRGLNKNEAREALTHALRDVTKELIQNPKLPYKGGM